MPGFVVEEDSRRGLGWVLRYGLDGCGGDGGRKGNREDSFARGDVPETQGAGRIAS